MAAGSPTQRSEQFEIARENKWSNRWQWCRYWNGVAVEEALVVVTLAIIAWAINNRRPLPRLHIPRWMTITGTALLLAVIYHHLIGTHGFGLPYKYACGPIVGATWVTLCHTWRMESLMQSVAAVMLGSAAWIASSGQPAPNPTTRASTN